MADSNRQVKEKQKGQFSGRVEKTKPIMKPAELKQLRLFLKHWEITPQGSLVPKTNATVDLGNAEQKVRHLYLSQN